MKTLVRMETARDQKDRHFSRAREGDKWCERETKQQLARTSQKRKVQNLLDEWYQGETFLCMV